MSSKLVIVCAVLTILGSVSSQDGETVRKCYQCGGTDNICETKESLGAEVECGSGVTTCMVTSSDDSTYRRCGKDIEVEKFAECKKVGVGAQAAQDAEACWCLGDLCNGSFVVVASKTIFVLAILLSLNAYV